MLRPSPHLVIDARPRGPNGPLAAEQIQGRSVLSHLLEIVCAVDESTVVIHARQEEHQTLRELLGPGPAEQFRFATGPLPENAAILRVDRLYDPPRLRRALRRGHDPESSVLWRLDQTNGLACAEEELKRRQSYQPLGKYWALGRRRVGRFLRPTVVRPNALTIASAALMVGASTAVAFAPAPPWVNLATAAALALALVLDTADGHLARLQGTATPSAAGSTQTSTNSVTWHSTPQSPGRPSSATAVPFGCCWECVMGWANTFT